VYDQVTILRIDRIPGRLLVVGGGAVGCEYASIFAALGVEVTVMSPSPRLLRHLDTEICQTQEEVFNGMGIRLVLGAPFAGIGRVEGQLEVTATTGQRFRPEKVLFAMGRAGNIEGLGLAEAGVAVNEQGDIAVDDRFETSAPGVYAAGDVIGPPRLASVTMEQARVAVCHAFGRLERTCRAALASRDTPTPA
jgi:NAD(P) transhydrogenase